MKAAVAGARAAAEAMRASAEAAGVPAHDLRSLGGRTWLALPYDVRGAVVDALAEKLGTDDLLVVEAEMPLGGRGADLTATRYRAPGRRDEVDLDEEAAETLHEWLADAEGSGFDEETAALDLAWTFAADAEFDAEGEETAGAAEKNAWSARLARHLVDTGAIALRSTRLPIDEIEYELTFDGDERDPKADAAVGERLMSGLMKSRSVDEVFADEEALREAAILTYRKKA
jgi:hypothetical protein